MRIGVISDIHLNLWPYGDSQSRLLDSIRAMDEAFRSMLYDHPVDIIVFTGDLFHTLGSVNTVILSHLDSLMREWANVRPNTPRVFLPGNHDMGRRTSEHHSLGVLRSYGEVIDYQGGEGTSLYNYLEDTPIYGLPYTEDVDALRSFLDKCESGSIVLLHQGVSGVEVTSKGFTLNEILTPSMIPDHIAHCFTGHYHTHKNVSNNLTIPGALTQHNFGDVDDPRGWLIVEIDSNGKHIEQYESSAPKFHSLRFEEAMKRTDFNERDFYRVTEVPPTEIPTVAESFKSLPVMPQILSRAESPIPYSTPDTFDLNISNVLEDYIKERDISDKLAKVGRSLLCD